MIRYDTAFVRKKKVEILTLTPSQNFSLLFILVKKKNQTTRICISSCCSRFAESEGRRHLEELKENRSNMMERKRKLEAAKAKGLRSKQLAEGEDADATIAKINRDIELANCQVCVQSFIVTSIVRSC